MFKTKNLFALMALGSALTLVGCGDDDNGSTNPPTDGDGGADSGVVTTVDPTETSAPTDATETSAAATDSGTEGPVDTDAEAPVDGDAGDAGDAEVPAPVDTDAGDAEAPGPVDADAGDAEVPATVDAEAPVETSAPAADAGDAG